MTTSTMETPNYGNQQRELPNKHFPNNTHCVSIDGPGSKITSALQVVTEALSSTENVSKHSSSSNALPLDNSLTSTHTTTNLNSNSLGFPTDRQNDNQSCTQTFLLNQATHSSQSTSFEHSPPDPTQGSSNASSSSNFSSLDSIRTNNGGDIVTPQGTIVSATGKTIVSPDSDVSNGFVKDGKMLPYVFEANEAGVRKRTSKILPVCGVCGKRFVCVTTMKRHLVTHTGEKPFCCKVCGKQYTQKGNLRVHERTHRNDRPFECNICHQKFYRKEPMQKHQWRQHGIVHFKSRPLHPPSESSSCIEQSSANSSILESSCQNDISFTAAAPTSTLVVKRENHQYSNPSQQDHPALSLTSKYDGNQESSLPHIGNSQKSTFPLNYSQPPEAHRSSSSNGRDRSISPSYKHHRESSSREQFKDTRNQSLQLQPPQAHRNNGKHSEFIESSNISRKETQDVCVNLSSNTLYNPSQISASSSSTVPKSASGITISAVPLKLDGEFRNRKQIEISNLDIERTATNTIHIASEMHLPHPTGNKLEVDKYLPTTLSPNINHINPTKMIEPAKTNSSSAAIVAHSSFSSTANTFVVTENQTTKEKQNIPIEFGNMSNKNNVVIIIPQIPKEKQAMTLTEREFNRNTEECTETDKSQSSNDSGNLQHAPLKLKMKFAQAYQKEVQEQREKERQRDEEDSRQLGGSCSGVQQIIIKGLDKMELQDGQLSNTPASLTRESSPSNSMMIHDRVNEQQQQQHQQPKEMVECQCKSCGCTFVVHDPYNFRCDNCNMKYTSMPTHLIADPLQCIGCCQVFPHKPALKSHQMSPQVSSSDLGMINTPTNDSKERPFRCCKCGYGFRQKAHLQKHQWRIHRRRIEPMDQQPIKEAEAFFHAIKSSKALSVKPSVSEQGAAKSNDPDVTTVTIQDIINHGVEHSLRSTRPFPGKNTTSSKYFSDVLGLEFEGNNSNMSSNQEDADNETMDENASMEDVVSYDNSNSGVDNIVQMQDSTPEEIINVRRPLVKEKYTENAQPLDLSPIKKGTAIDYSNKSKLSHESLSTACDGANKNRNCQSSTIYPPKITLRLRDFASTDVPTNQENYSHEFISNQQESREDVSNQLYSSKKHNMVARSLINTDQKMSESSFVSSVQGNQREDNPLLNQRPLPTTQVSFIKALQTPNNNVGNVPTASMAPAWKKPRTSSPTRFGYSEHSNTAYEPTSTPVSVISDVRLGVADKAIDDTNVSTHRTLPPIGNLQKPMSLVRKLLPTATSLSISSNASSHGSKLSITCGQGNVMQNGSLNLQIGNRITDQTQVKNIQSTSIKQNQISEVSVSFPNIVSKSGNAEFVRDKLLQLTSQNLRTV